jgi:hypothetical protein
MGAPIFDLNQTGAAQENALYAGTSRTSTIAAIGTRHE